MKTSLGLPIRVLSSRISSGTEKSLASSAEDRHKIDHRRAANAKFCLDVLVGNFVSSSIARDMVIRSVTGLVANASRNTFSGSSHNADGGKLFLITPCFVLHNTIG